MSVADARGPQQGAAGGRVVRHKSPDRLFHWLMATSVLALLITGFLPILGVKFAWVTMHWTAGAVLTAAVLFHLVRSVGWLDLWSLAIGWRNIRDALCTLRRDFAGSGPAAGKPGKYTLAQKLYHHVITVIVLASVTTGLLMMVKVDTPFWQRDPYLLSSYTWGVIYVIHGYTAMSIITLLIAHVYFALRPEKLWYTRSMILGWITHREYHAHFDPERWKIDRIDVEPSERLAGPVRKSTI
jgi:cytochrome b subunit of formate dehydrogenase